MAKKTARKTAKKKVKKAAKKVNKATKTTVKRVKKTAEDIGKKFSESQKYKEWTQMAENGIDMLKTYVAYTLKDKDKLDKVVKGALLVAESYFKNHYSNKTSHESQPNKVSLKVKTLDSFEGELPKYESFFASGFDVRAQLSESLVIKKGERALVPTGLAFEIPQGYELQARPRSGLAIRHGLSLVNTPGTIDADYRGEVKIILINHGDEDFVIENQMRIAQLVLASVIQGEFEKVEDLSESARGTGGFGSTGV